MNPAIRIVFAPLFSKSKTISKAGGYIHGETEGRTIWIDPRSSQLLDTMVHEMTHVNHPDWSEELVRGYTAARMKKMGWKEKAGLLRLLGRAKIKGEDDDD